MRARPWSSGERVLDVACGTGVLLERLVDVVDGLQAVGVDVSPAMLERSRAKRLGRDVHWVRADARRLPLVDAAFDVVVCSSALHYFREPEECLREMQRVLAPGGTLILVDWLREGWPMQWLDRRLRRRHPAYMRMYNGDECLRLLEQAGFRPQSRRRFRAGALWRLMLWTATKPEE